MSEKPVTCLLCGHTAPEEIVSHIQEKHYAHGLAGYLSIFPFATVLSETGMKAIWANIPIPTLSSLDTATIKAAAEMSRPTRSEIVVQYNDAA